MVQFRGRLSSSEARGELLDELVFIARTSGEDEYRDLILYLPTT
jgi:hypothetical protein